MYYQTVIEKWTSYLEKNYHEDDLSERKKSTQGKVNTISETKFSIAQGNTNK